ncbi:sensor histidine kinase [Rhizobium halophytocola]|uniref:histidine kinase n=1 Tax=Rhizobium halophytocola TaxID=735519 RepID=A0ABS4E6I7_9HYPH|nr:ATP-binding protein [Rhizobium halophytocola]MBP1853543.1 signal transduction histidine kinase [Rhizobium halophytocola]
MDGVQTRPKPIRILVVDDDIGDRKQVRRALQKAPFPAELVEASELKQAITECDLQPFDCAIIDYRMPSGDGLHGISMLREKWPYMAIVMLTGQGDEQVAMDAIKRGATDYLPKGTEGSLPQVVDSAIAKMRLQRKVERQREELEMFSDVLVHDLMAPTRSIQGFGRFIQNNLRDGNLEKAATNCELVISAARRMDRLIKTLHAYTQADHLPMVEPVWMEKVVQAALQNLEAEISELVATITTDAMPEVVGHEPQLIQLLQNLIGNSLKYRSEVPIKVHVTAARQGGYWRIAVQDNGMGISEGDAQRMFDPLVRLHQSRGIDGTGLGLATCRRIITRHGGEISARPRPEGGTEVYFTLPDATDASPPADPDPVHDANPRA